MFVCGQKHEAGIAYNYKSKYIWIIKFIYTNINKKYTIYISRHKVVIKREITLWYNGIKYKYMKYVIIVLLFECFCFSTAILQS